MISEGLLPRFTMIEYRGERPPLNEGHMEVKPSPDLVSKLAELCGHSLMLNKQNVAIKVQLDEKALAMMRQFNQYADDKINATRRDLNRQLWNRAHVKALKLAALLAVGDHPYEPVITEASAAWAINLVVTDIVNLYERFENGEVGHAESSDTKQIADVSVAISEYILRPFEALAKYQINSVMHSSRIIPYSYISRRCAANTSLRTDRGGSTSALKKVLQALIDRGDLQEVPAHECRTKFSTTARCFAIANPKSFSLA
jgi:hypothetical protein